MTRLVAGLMVGAALLLGGPDAAAAGSAPGRRWAYPTAASSVPARPPSARYSTPLPVLHVLRRYDPPATPYGPGHLGVDLAATPGQQVTSAGDGVVRFAGSVAGRGLVVVAHADGISTEYESVRPSLRAGAVVRRGQPIGWVDGTHRGCARGRCLHWGARRAGAYFDPLLLLRPLGAVRLLPWR